ncbi:hypothetical protein AgCh_012849 [Apium graveolens]
MEHAVMYLIQNLSSEVVDGRVAGTSRSTPFVSLELLDDKGERVVNEVTEEVNASAGNSRKRAMSDVIVSRSRLCGVVGRVLRLMVILRVLLWLRCVLTRGGQPMLTFLSGISSRKRDCVELRLRPMRLRRGNLKELGDTLSGVELSEGEAKKKMGLAEGEVPELREANRALSEENVSLKSEV